MPPSIFVPRRPGNANDKKRRVERFSVLPYDRNDVRDVVDCINHIFPLDLVFADSNEINFDNSLLNEFDVHVDAAAQTKDFKRMMENAIEKFADYLINEVIKTKESIEQLQKRHVGLVAATFVAFLHQKSFPTWAYKTVRSRRRVIAVLVLSFAADGYCPAITDAERDFVILSPRYISTLKLLKKNISAPQSIHQSRPIAPTDYRELVYVVEPSFIGWRDKLMMNLARTWCLRMGSVVEAKVHDVHFHNGANGEPVCVFNVYTRKGNPNHPVVLQPIEIYGQEAEMMHRWNSFAVEFIDPFVRFKGTMPFFRMRRTENFAKELKKLTKYAGYPENFFKPHGFRVGCAAFTVAQQCWEDKNFRNFRDHFESMRVLGGWKGQTIIIYLRGIAIKHIKSDVAPEQLAIEQLHRDVNGFAKNNPVRISPRLNQIIKRYVACVIKEWIEQLGWYFARFKQPFNAKRLDDYILAFADKFDEEAPNFRELRHMMQSPTEREAKLELLTCLIANKEIERDISNVKHQMVDDVNERCGILLAYEVDTPYLTMTYGAKALHKQPPQCTDVIYLDDFDNPDIAQRHYDLKRLKRVSVTYSK